MSRTPLLAITLALSAGTLAVAACGKRGDPLPPMRRTPQAVTELHLAQRGTTLEIRVQAPRATTEGERLGVVTLEILRGEGDAALGKSAARQQVKAAPGERLVIREALPAPGSLIRVAAIATSNKRASTQSATRSLKVADPVPAPRELVAQMEAEGVRLRFVAPDPMPAWIEPAKPAPKAGGAKSGPGAGGPTPAGTVPDAAGRPEAPPAEPTGAPSEAPAAAPIEAPTEAPFEAPSEGQATPPAGPAPGTAPSPEPPPRTSGIRVYRRSDPGAYGAPLNEELLAETPYLDSAAPLGARVCYEVRTVVSGDPLIESDATPEACLLVEDKKAPAPPAGVATLPVDDGIEVSWSPSGETDLALYRVYRQARGAAAVRVAEVAPSETSAVDREAGPGQRFQYFVTAVDAAGNESAASPTAEGVRR